MLVLTQVFKPSVVIAQHISRNVTLSGRFTSGSSHSLPLAGPSSSSSHSLPLAGPSSSSSHSLPLAGPSSSSSHSLPLAGPSSSSSHSLPLAGPSSSSSHSLPLTGPSSSSSHSLPLAGPSSSSSHSYPVVATSSIPHTLPAARPSFSGPHTPLVAVPNFLAFFCAYFVCCQNASSSGRSLLVQFSGGTYCDKSVQSIHTCHHYWPSGLLCAQRSMPDVLISCLHCRSLSCLDTQWIIAFVFPKDGDRPLVQEIWAGLGVVCLWPRVK